MIKIYDESYVISGKHIITCEEDLKKILDKHNYENVDKNGAKKGTISYKILNKHNTGDENSLKLKFDSITSHDITYVGIIQTARSSGMKKFPIPYVLTNCHNSLCAVGGTINEDDHKFGLSAAKKYGGIYVPPNVAVIHSYNREMMTKCGGMILGSDSHTRYGALGTMGVGEGGGELVKQLLEQDYEIERPGVIAVVLRGKPEKGVGPQDVALTLIKSVFDNNFVKNKVIEFIGEGIKNLPIEYRNGIDVMTTETACWSSIWQTDNIVEDYYIEHGRKDDFKEIKPDFLAYYDGIVEIDLSKVRPSIALPFHPSNVYTIEEFKDNTIEIISKIEKDYEKIFGKESKELNLKDRIVDNEFYVDQGIVAGCAGGTYDNIVAMSDILNGKSIGNDKFSLSVYPGSQPAYIELIKNGYIEKLMNSGTLIRSAFCGPCFGAGDTPGNREFSIRHTTRNFPNREGSKPGEGQISLVALMDARSISATALNGGKLTGANELDIEYSEAKYNFNPTVYKNRVYNGFGKPNSSEDLVFGPNIKDWPATSELTENLLLKVVSYITDPVTTTDELIPSGETSSYRSNPYRLAEFTLSRKDPNYVKEAKIVQEYEKQRKEGKVSDELKEIYNRIKNIKEYKNIEIDSISIGSTIYANKPGDGSAREQAASCQRVLGATANIAKEYATKRYRTNLINWGIIPFTIDDSTLIEKNDFIFIPNIKQALSSDSENVKAYVLKNNNIEIRLNLGYLNRYERDILICGSLINYNKKI